MRAHIVVEHHEYQQRRGGENGRELKCLSA